MKPVRNAKTIRSSNVTKENLSVIAGVLKAGSADAVVLPARRQMPSLAAAPLAEALTGKTVFIAALATKGQMLKDMELDRCVAGCGTLLSGAY